MCEYIILEDFKMDKYIYDENNGLWYELQGEYYLPCLSLPPEEEKPKAKARTPGTLLSAPMSSLTMT